MITRCKKCLIDKPIEEFHKNTKAKNGHYSQCKKCHSEYAREYYHRNKERVLERNRKYHSKNKERIAEMRSTYYQNNKEYLAEWKAQHQKDNKAQYAEATARRKASKLKATPEWLTDDDKDVIRWIYEMREERSEATGVEHHVDHIVPLQGKDACGLHVWWNLQVIPASENLRKSNNLI